MTLILTASKANRNRTYQVLYDNNIGNNIMIAGDSHANWVSDLVWFDHSEYDPMTGAGSMGVEFGGTAVSSSGYGDNTTQGNEQAQSLVEDNSELQWTEGYFRGYFQMHLNAEMMEAKFFGTSMSRPFTFASTYSKGKAMTNLTLLQAVPPSPNASPTSSAWRTSP